MDVGWTNPITRRRTRWFKLAFGSYGLIRPPNHAAEILGWTSLGEWFPEPKTWEEDTKPG
jgi:hypothetical protein